MATLLLLQPKKLNVFQRSEVKQASTNQCIAHLLLHLQFQLSSNDYLDVRQIMAMLL